MLFKKILEHYRKTISQIKFDEINPGYNNTYTQCLSGHSA